MFGGGTILLPEIAAGRLTPTRALMLHRAGMASVRVDGDRVVIGAMTPVAALVDGPDLVLAEVARHIADEEIRRSATVGSVSVASRRASMSSAALGPQAPAG